MTVNRPAMIERHLRLLGSKLQMGYFLVRIKELRTRLAQQPDPTPLIADRQPTELDLLLRDCPDFRVNENGTVPLTSQPVSECPDFCVNKNGTVPFSPTDISKANQAPSPEPGKFDVLTPKNGPES